MYFILFLKTKLITIEVRELCKKLCKNLEIQDWDGRIFLAGLRNLFWYFPVELQGRQHHRRYPCHPQRSAMDRGQRASLLSVKLNQRFLNVPYISLSVPLRLMRNEDRWQYHTKLLQNSWHVRPSSNDRTLNMIQRNKDSCCGTNWPC